MSQTKAWSKDQIEAKFPGLTDKATGYLDASKTVDDAITAIRNDYPLAPRSVARSLFVLYGRDNGKRIVEPSANSEFAARVKKAA